MIPDFRAAGYTDAAANYPLSGRAMAVMEDCCGLPRTSMPPAYFYAPNAYMRDWLDQLGGLLEKGRPIKDELGRYLSPKDC